MAFHHVPTLACLCILKVASFPDQIPQNLALTYVKPRDISEFDILKALIPSYNGPDCSLDLSAVDPCLWATLVQIYSSSLPETFINYSIALKHTHLPLLQQIQSTPSFSLVTILELPGCPQLSDNTVLNIKPFASLIAFDASHTGLSSWGLRKLWLPPISADDLDSSGPWGLRIIRLRGCKAIDQTIFKALRELSLLSVVDLRGTSIDPTTIPVPFSEWSSACLEQSSLALLYHPTPLTVSFSLLRNTTVDFHSSPTIFQLHINKFEFRPYRDHPATQPAVEIQDKAFTFSPNTSTVISHDPPADYMQSVAETESSEQAKRQKIRNFYAPAKVPLSRPSRFAQYGYSAEKYYSDYNYREMITLRRNSVWQKFDDSGSNRPTKKRKLSDQSILNTKVSPLMLYRSPPRWHTDHAPPPITKSNYSDTLSSNRASGPQMQIIANFQSKQKLGARKHPSNQSRDSMNTFDGTPSTTTTRLVTKPEKIKVDNVETENAQGATAAISQTHQLPTSSPTLISSLPTRETTTTNPLTAETNSTLPTRPLKPISSVRVPELPPDEMRKLKGSMESRKGSGRASLPASSSTLNSGDQIRRNSLPPRKDGNIKKIMERMASSDASASSGHSEGFGLFPPFPETDSRIHSNANPKRQNTGFDWKSWGA
ncbi:hypothetical protein BDP27DRAFT_1420757 [Rhodocollybia butyracea]|uniref:Uncharacterized protein n=1 Tax=Rhodocollybia butyracea TaxID=206335 RepID=A0A9P5U898_9AGAR|nr:hypothetical protein BDP27DRAFT_1420757 [Rhodocollybia butyracea]